MDIYLVFLVVLSILNLIYSLQEDVMQQLEFGTSELKFKSLVWVDMLIQLNQFYVKQMSLKLLQDHMITWLNFGILENNNVSKH